MRRSHLRAALLTLLFAAPLLAQISPGELSKFHTKLEGLDNCTKCHELRKEVTNDNCLACHTSIQTRIKAEKGYHSSDEVRSQKCSKCHAEHFGLEFELVHWKEGKENFDHGKSGWPLVGAHSRAGCRNCHTPDLIVDEAVRTSENVSLERTYLGLGTACLDCHVDEHRGQLSTNCVDCHSQDAWKPATAFNHDRAKYPLTGKHKEAACEKCHTAAPVVEASPAGKIAKKENSGSYALYRDLQFNNCAPCHRDVHENKFGTDCASCHTTDGFQQIAGRQFDHSRTGYPLLGKHITVQCAKCHTSGKTTDPVAHEACTHCHRDAHRGQLADRTDKGKCESCHTVDGFRPALYDVADHESSRYPLTGSHLAVPCFACHAEKPFAGNASAIQFDFADLTCKGCHADVHRGQLDTYIGEGGCEYCHNTATWHEVSFDHSRTRFPLVGRHETTACMGCHTVENPGTELELIRMSPLAQECAMCHRDPHNNQFLRAEAGEETVQCKRCHTPTSWKTLSFDHNRDARWALDGAHQKVACSECHKAVFAGDGTQYVLYKPLGSACADCHVSRSEEIR